MKVINFFGGPGCGKSTLAALTFSHLKLKGVNVELVTEFAKDLVWEDRDLTNQIFIFANQLHRLDRLRGKVDYAVIDSPLPLSIIYNKRGGSGLFERLINEVFHEFDNINFFVVRTKPFMSAGRAHNYEESLAIDREIKERLDYDFVDVGNLEEVLEHLRCW